VQENPVLVLIANDSLWMKDSGVSFDRTRKGACVDQAHLMRESTDGGISRARNPVLILIANDSVLDEGLELEF